MLDKAKLVGEELCHGNNDYKSSGIFYGLLLAPKRKSCLIIDNFGFVEEHKTFERLNDSKRLLDSPEDFKMIERKKLSALLPKNWKKSVDSRIFIPTKLRFCNECNNKNGAINVTIKPMKAKKSKLI